MSSSLGELLDFCQPLLNSVQKVIVLYKVSQDYRRIGGRVWTVAETELKVNLVVYQQTVKKVPELLGLCRKPAQKLGPFTKLVKGHVIIRKTQLHKNIFNMRRSLSKLISRSKLQRFFWKLPESVLWWYQTDTKPPVQYCDDTIMILVSYCRWYLMYC